MRIGDRLNDERGVLGFSLIRWILVLALFGLVAIETGSIIFTTIGLQGASDAAALEAADVWEHSRNFKAAKEAALASLDDQEQDQARITKFEADGFEPFEVRLTTQKRASTLVVQHIGFLKDFATVEAESQAHAA